MPSLTDLNGHHEDLVARVIAYARAAGWREVPMTYHDRDGGDALRLANDMTGIFFRTLPDLVLTNGRRALMVEVKTGVFKHANAASELFPIVMARDRWRVARIPTLYVYENPHFGVSAAWWGHEVFDDVPVTAIYMGTQRPEWREYMAWVRHWQSINLIPGDVPLKTIENRGSGDPYVVIPERVLRTLLPWHVVLGDALGR